MKDSCQDMVNYIWFFLNVGKDLELILGFGFVEIMFQIIKSLVYISRKHRCVHLGLEVRKRGNGKKQSYEDIRLANTFIIFIIGFYLLIYHIYPCIWMPEVNL